jgi:hypothetical protein
MWRIGRSEVRRLFCGSSMFTVKAILAFCVRNCDLSFFLLKETFDSVVFMSLRINNNLLPKD